MSNELSYKEINGYKSHKFIDLFNKRTGRIKRMMAKDVYPFVDLNKRTRKKYADAFPRCNATITRWNRH